MEKTNQTKAIPMPIYLTPELKDKLRYLAYKLYVTQSSIIVDALEKHTAKLLKQYPGYEVENDK